MTDQSPFVVYLLESVDVNRTYIGSTSNLNNRILEHNGVYGRGRATKQTWGHRWVLNGYVAGFTTRSKALSFEYSWRRCCSSQKATPIIRRYNGLLRLLNLSDMLKKWETYPETKLVLYTNTEFQEGGYGKTVMLSVQKVD